jgi:hypothetical protein
MTILQTQRPHFASASRRAEKSLYIAGGAENILAEFSPPLARLRSANCDSVKGGQAIEFENLSRRQIRG